MRIKYLHINSEFKNLNNFRIEFDSPSFLDVIIGKNGTGKSNLFEAIIEIFRCLSNKKLVLGFDYEIAYQIRDKNVIIKSTNNKLEINGKDVKSIESIYLPDNIIVYYSGHNPRVFSLVSEYEASYKAKIKGEEVKDLRLLFGLGSKHRNILLLLLLAQDKSNFLRKNLLQYLHIANVPSDIKISLKKPFYFKGGLDSWDSNPFWGVKGYLLPFLLELTSIKTVSSAPRDEGYFSEREEYIFYLNPNQFSTIINKYSSLKVFQYFDDLRVIEMFSEIDFEVKLASGNNLKVCQFSDGEFQTIFFNSLLELFKDKECIMLLDEPDAFLHPEWQFSLIKRIIELADIYALKNHVILSSHNASTLVSSNDHKINLFKFKNKNIVCHSVSKNYAIEQLSAGLISLNEEKQTLCIINKIRLERKPVLFTEGLSDPLIIETAWNKIKKSPLPFIPIYAFNDTYLGRLIQDEKVHNENSGKPLFGLFDFDEAFNVWNGIKGFSVETDPCKGLCKQLKVLNGYVFLLPVPNIPQIKTQVIKNEEAKTTFKHESRLTLELLFFGHSDTSLYFIEERCRGGGMEIRFKDESKKMQFAKDIVPNLPKKYFKVFKPMFDFIESKI